MHSYEHTKKYTRDVQHVVSLTTFNEFKVVIRVEMVSIGDNELHMRSKEFNDSKIGGNRAKIAPLILF